MEAEAADRDVDARIAAAKCLEIADIYDLYQEALHKHGGVDFGDLIMRPACLMEDDHAVRIGVQLRHRHVLVDEYQDVNRASARLLRRWREMASGFGSLAMHGSRSIVFVVLPPKTWFGSAPITPAL